MKKKVLALLICVTLLFLVGCGKTNTEPTPGEQPSDVESSATDWPKKAITLTIACSPGGDTDFNIRTIGSYLEKELGVPVVATNIIGAGGLTGYRHAKDAAPDGYTLLSDHSAFIVAKAIGQHDYGFDNAFELVGSYATVPGEVVCVNAKSGITNMKELIEATEKAPGKLKIATNIGSTTQIVSNMIEEAGAKVTHVDVGGTPEKVVALLGGHADIISGQWGALKQYVDAGEMNVLGIFEKERHPLIPDVPTFAEQGYDSLKFDPPFSHFFLAFPKGTDQAIVDKMAAACEKIVTTNKDYAEDIKRFNEVPTWRSAKEAMEVYKTVEERCKVFLK